jgi:hypothetical protein
MPRLQFKDLQESTNVDSEDLGNGSTTTMQSPFKLEQIPTISESLSRLSKKQLFEKTLLKANELAKIFNGIVKSESQFSICKGVFSIRFNCQNEHNFYLTI